MTTDWIIVSLAWYGILVTAVLAVVCFCYEMKLWGIRNRWVSSAKALGEWHKEVLEDAWEAADYAKRDAKTKER